jgi:hypothetical protein
MRFIDDFTPQFIQDMDELVHLGSEDERMEKLSVMAHQHRGCL